MRQQPDFFFLNIKKVNFSIVYGCIFGAFASLACAQQRPCQSQRITGYSSSPTPAGPTVADLSVWHFATACITLLHDECAHVTIQTPNVLCRENKGTQIQQNMLSRQVLYIYKGNFKHNAALSVFIGVQVSGRELD